MLRIYPSEKTTIIYLSNFQDLNTSMFEKNLTALVFTEKFAIPLLRKEITFSEDVLNEYAGVYGEEASMQLKIKVEHKALVVYAPGGDKIELTAEAKDKFFMKGTDIDVNFNRDNGAIISIFVNIGGGQQLKKIE